MAMYYPPEERLNLIKLAQAKYASLNSIEIDEKIAELNQARENKLNSGIIGGNYYEFDLLALQELKENIGSSSKDDSTATLSSKNQKNTNRNILGLVILALGGYFAYNYFKK